MKKYLLFSAALILCVTVWAQAQQGVSHQAEPNPGHTGSNLHQNHDPATFNQQPLEQLLNPDGTLDLTGDFSGSLNPAGFRMVTDPSGKPRFIREQSDDLGNPGYFPSNIKAEGDENWHQFPYAPDGVNGNVYAITVSGNDVYVGGNFTEAGGSSANYIAKWDGASWSALGSGVNNTVRTIAIYGSDVYVGGNFTEAGGSSANRIAKWDGTSWSALGSGVNNWVYAIAVSGTDVYVGGAFDEAGGEKANGIAKWNGMSWSVVGYGVDNFVYAIAVTGSDIYVGGAFTRTGNNVFVNSIAKWDGTSWSALGSGVNGYVSAIAVSGSDVYVGGNFTEAGGKSANYIAAWIGNSWYALGSGVNNSVGEIVVIGDDVYVGGAFTEAGSVSAKRIAKWDWRTLAWSPLGSGLTNTVRAIAISGSDVYVGGAFLQAGDESVSYIAKWEDTCWMPFTYGINNIVMAIVDSGSDVYMGGAFTLAGWTSANRITRWDGTYLKPLGSGVSGPDLVMPHINEIVTSGSDVIVGGHFYMAGDLYVPFIGKWDGTSWSPLGSGVNNTVIAIAVSGSDVYAGGIFTKAGDVVVNRIAKWDGVSWSALGSGVNNTVRAIAISGSDVYVGGNFTEAGGSSANYIAKWDGVSWSALGSGVNNFVNTVAITENDLYVGGSFTEAGGSSANYIAKWDGISWSALGSGVNNWVNTIAVSGSDAYVGGYFTEAGGMPSHYFARWTEPDLQENHQLTLNLDMSYAPSFDPETDLVYVTGTLAGFWPEPGTDPDNQLMTRVGESMIWTKTFFLQEGDYEYKYFLNAGWVDGEWHEEINRHVAVQGDMEINDLWGHFILELVTEPEEGGAVSGGGIYSFAAEVLVEAQEAEGFEFVNWTRDDMVVSILPSFNFTMPTRNVTLIANFIPSDYETVSTLAELRSKPPGETLYRYNGQAVITAMPGMAMPPQPFIYSDFEDNQNVAFPGWPITPTIVENPDASGINTSGMVAQWQRSEELYAHVYAELDWKIDFSIQQVFTVKIWSPIACEVLFKVEDKTNYSIAVEIPQSVTLTEQWVELTYDFSGAESGIYDKIVIFMDFLSTESNTFYFDDVTGPAYYGAYKTASYVFKSGTTDKGTSRNRKFIQDHTAAIMIFDAPENITTRYKLYDVITNVTGQIDVRYNMVQFLPARNAPAALDNTPVEPTIFALDEVNPDDQAKLIKFCNVTFDGIIAGEVFAGGQNYTITDGVNTFVLRTLFWEEDYIGMEIPHGTLNITGVVTQFYEEMQITPRFAADIEPLAGGNIMVVRDATASTSGAVTIELEIINEDEFVGFNADMSISSGFTYVPGSAQLHRDNGHFLAFDILPGNVARMISAAVPTTPFLGNEGVIVSFDLQTPDEEGTFHFCVTDAVITDRNGLNIMTGDICGVITLYERSTVTFSVTNYLGNEMVNATITLNGVANPAGDYVFENIEHGTYQYTVEKDCYVVAEDFVAVSEPDVHVEVLLENMLGDANNDGVVNVSDIVIIVNYFMGQSPDPFCFINADVNGDGVINVSDVVGATNIFMGGKASPNHGLESQKAHVYLYPDGIYIESDGTLTAMQFELQGKGLEALSLASILSTHQIMYSKKYNELIAILFSLSNEPIPEGMVRIIDFYPDENNLQWGEVLVANLNAELVIVETHKDEATAVTDIDCIENIQVYPNPAKDLLWIELVNNSENPVQVSLRNIHGQTIRSIVIRDSGYVKTSMYFGELPAGIYMLQFKTSRSATTKRVMVRQ